MHSHMHMHCVTEDPLWGSAHSALASTPGSWALVSVECGSLRFMSVSPRAVVTETVRAKSDVAPWGFALDRYEGVRVAQQLAVGAGVRFDGAGAAEAGAARVRARRLDSATPFGSWTGQQCLEELAEMDGRLPWVADLDAARLRAAIAGREYITIRADAGGVTAGGADVAAPGCGSGRAIEAGIESSALAPLPSSGRVAMRALTGDYVVAFDSDPGPGTARISVLCSPATAETHEDVLCAMLNEM